MDIKLTFLIPAFLLVVGCSNKRDEETYNKQLNDLVILTLQSSSFAIANSHFYEIRDFCEDERDKKFMDSCYNNFGSLFIVLEDYHRDIDELLSGDFNSESFDNEIFELRYHKTKLLFRAKSVIFWGSGQRDILTKRLSSYPFNEIFSFPNITSKDRDHVTKELLDEKIRASLVFWYTSAVWYPMYFPKGRT